MSERLSRRPLPVVNESSLGSSRTVISELQFLVENPGVVESSLPRIPVKEVVIPDKLGFCAGVQMAIQSLDELVRLYPEENVYVFHGVVHNDWVIKHFEERGVVFVDEQDLPHVPKDSPLMLPPHGSSPAQVEAASADRSIVIDTTCPLVHKVHGEAKRLSRNGKTIEYIGHHNHQEGIGVQGEVSPERWNQIESIEEVDDLYQKLGPDADVAILTQTTWSLAEWEPIEKAIKDRWPNAWTPPKSDICYATTNRQEALKRIIDGGVETVLVATSKHSSNGMALVHEAERKGIPAYPVLLSEDVPLSVRDRVVGITAAASTPVEVIFNILNRLNSRQGVTFAKGEIEEEQFRLPVELRKLIQEKKGHER